VHDTNPRFKAGLVRISPIGIYTHAILSCPRCGRNMGVTEGMVAGIESIVCKGRFATGDVCNGHYYWRGGRLVFVGTVPG
jgi:hypothetical protein